MQILNRAAAKTDW